MKRLLLVVLIGILVFPVIEATIYAKKIRCSETGFLSFEAQYACVKDKCTQNPRKQFSSIQITAVHPQKNYTLIIENPPEFLDDKTTYDLVTKQGILEPYKKYMLVINDSEEMRKYPFTCSNIKFLCEKINLAVDLCQDDQVYFYFLFHGLGNQFSGRELREEIRYYVNPANTYFGSVLTHGKDLDKSPIMSEELPPDYEVRHIGSDRYVLKVPKLDLDNKKLDKIYMEVKSCDKAQYPVAAYKECEKRECFTEEHCPIGSTCKNNVCSILLCTDCQSIDGHRCVSACQPRNECEDATCNGNSCEYTKKDNCCLEEADCDDQLVCTEDKCLGGRCVHKDVQCEAAEDPCVLGQCKEPKGCGYVRNESCFNESGLLQITGRAVEDVFMSKPAILTARIVLIVVLGVLVYIYIKNKIGQPKRRKRKI